MSNVICMLQGGILFVGRLPHLGLHATVSTAAIVGLDDLIVKKVADEYGWLPARCFAFNGTLRHETIMNGTVGILFGDPGGPVSRMLNRELGGHSIIANPSWTDEFLQTCLAMRDARNSDSYGEILRRGFPLGRVHPPGLIAGDGRLTRIMRELTHNPHENCDTLADKVGMSPSWVQHRFKHVVGMPIRTSRKWFRMRTAALTLQQGGSLVDAALSAGFYDQSHFTNVFRGIFGVSPNLALWEGGETQWYIDDALVRTGPATSSFE